MLQNKEVDEWVKSKGDTAFRIEVKAAAETEKSVARIPETRGRKLRETKLQRQWLRSEGPWDLGSGLRWHN